MLMPRTRPTLIKEILVTVCIALTHGISVAAEAEIQVLGVRKVDYHDQPELPLPQNAGLEALVGRDASAQAPSGLVPGAISRRPHRSLLRVEFRSSKKLSDIARQGGIVFLESFFCSRPQGFAVLAFPTVYANGEAVRPGMMPEVHGQESYYFFVNGARKESLNSRPPQIGFDLGADPQDLCFYVTGNVSGHLTYKSKITRISKAEIAAAMTSP
jgi:hypothetical protein